MRKLREHLKLFIGEIYLFFCSSTLGFYLLDLLDHIKYSFMSDEEKKAFDARKIQNELIFNSLLKILDLSNALLYDDFSNIDRLKNKVLWDNKVNQIQPNINFILQIENKDELLLKLCDVSNSLLDEM